jgi:hypothetical protein
MKKKQRTELGVQKLTRKKSYKKEKSCSRSSTHAAKCFTYEHVYPVLEFKSELEC